MGNSAHYPAGAFPIQDGRLMGWRIHLPVPVHREHRSSSTQNPFWMKTQASPGLPVLAAGVAAVMSLLPFTAVATPAFNWDFKTYYPHADTQQASLTPGQTASITQLDGYYPTGMVNATGTGLTPAELDEVAAM